MYEKLYILIFWFISLSACSQGQSTYYVKNDGNDSFIGTSDSQAWKTLAKLHSVVLNPGDSVLFKRGDKWIVRVSSDYIRANYSGTFKNPIVYSAYGTGPKPIIEARDTVNNWSNPSNWTNDGGNVWHMKTDINPNLFAQNNRGRLWLNGAEVGKFNSTSTCSAALPWTHNGQVIYVYATYNPASYYSMIESIGTYGDIVYAEGSYLVFQYLDIHGSTYSMDFYGSSNITIDSCDIGMWSGEFGISAKGSLATPCNNWIIKNCRIATGETIIDLYNFTNTEEGIKVSGYCDGWNIYNNSFSNWSHAAFNVQSYNSEIIKNIKFHDNYITAPTIDYGRGVAYQIAPGGYGLCTGNEYYNNYIYNVPTQSQISGDGLKFYNNIIDGVHGYSWRTDGGAAGLDLSTYLSDCKNNEIYNNVIMNARDEGIRMDYSGSRLYEGNIITNNIIVNNGLYQIRIDFSPKALRGQTFKNNILYKSGQTDVVYWGYDNSQDFNRTITEFNAENGNDGNVIANNISGDPLFENTSIPNYLLRDYHLQEGSPAIGAGINVGIVNDHDGYAWLSPPNIGAFTTGSNIVNPIYIESVVENANPNMLEITFDQTLDNLAPPLSAFTVLINNANISITGVSILGNKVQLILADAVTLGDNVTITYIKPINNAIRAGFGQVVSFFNKKVTNRVGSTDVPSELGLNIHYNPVQNVLKIFFEEPSLITYDIRIVSFSGKLLFEDLLNTSNQSVEIPVNLNTGIYIVQVLSGKIIMNAQLFIVIK